MTPRSARRRHLVAVLLGLAALVLPLLLTTPPATADQAESATFRVAAGSLTAQEQGFCVVLDGGAVRCWGSGSLNQHGLTTAVTGVGAVTRPEQHEPVRLGARARAVAGGSNFGCALLETGQVRCWGTNMVGTLGQGNTTPYPDKHPTDLPTVNLGAGRTARAIAAGTATACAILDTGQVRCWGANDLGQLGQGDTSGRATTTPGEIPAVNLGAGRTARAITLGDSHACALLDTGEVRCWGNNVFGELGQGNATTMLNKTPDAIPVVSLGRPARALSAGSHHTCAVLDTGELRCWGQNADGQLGVGNKTPTLAVPSSLSAVNLGVGRTAISVSAGVNHGNTCAILDTGEVRCWGRNVPASATKTPAELPSIGLGQPARALALANESSCAILANAEVRCWGEGGLGQLGQGNTTDQAAPVPVAIGGWARVRPATGIAQRVLPVRDRKRPYRFTFTGRVVGAFGPDEETCSGVVQVVVRKRKKVVGRGQTTLHADNGGCVYALNVTTKRKKRGKLVATTTFSGNTNVGPSGVQARVRAG